VTHTHTHTHMHTHTRTHTHTHTHFMHVCMLSPPAESLYSQTYTHERTCLARCVGLHACLSRASRALATRFPPKSRSLMEIEKPLLLIPVMIPC